MSTERPVGERGPVMTVVCATANPHKLSEMSAILGGVVELLPRPVAVGDVVEDAGTLEGNARLKATAIARASGLPALADDTGLFVVALDGAPGVETAYFAGPNATDAENRATVLASLEGVIDRRAEFVTVVIIVWPDGSEISARGVCPGRIAAAERGEGGFGYDPIFVPDDAADLTFAELGVSIKNTLSHRSRALVALVTKIRS
ncbi:MAG: RdgB/HAM1 family non-canonical purine NTP pyrophosphatase [Ilumatobacteraceae bacterium]